MHGLQLHSHDTLQPGGFPSPTAFSLASIAAALLPVAAARRAKPAQAGRQSGATPMARRNASSAWLNSPSSCAARPTSLQRRQCMAVGQLGQKGAAAARRAAAAAGGGGSKGCCAGHATGARISHRQWYSTESYSQECIHALLVGLERGLAVLQRLPGLPGVQTRLGGLQRLLQGRHARSGPAAARSELARRAEAFTTSLAAPIGSGSLAAGDRRV